MGGQGIASSCSTRNTTRLAMPKSTSPPRTNAVISDAACRYSFGPKILAVWQLVRRAQVADALVLGLKCHRDVHHDPGP